MTHTINNSLIWEIYDPKTTVEKTDELTQSIENNNLPGIAHGLRDAQFLRSLIVRRGENDGNFKLMKKAFDLLTHENKENLLEQIHKLEIPEQLLNELAHVAFHVRNEQEFFNCTNFILDNQDNFQNKSVIARAFHDRASWHSIHEQKEKSIEENKKALTLANQNNEKVIAIKAKFGLSYNKDFLKPKELADDFMQLAEALKREKVYYDALRAEIEAAKALVNLAERQEKKLKTETLLKAKNLALDVLRSAKDFAYPNAEIQARETLSKIYSKIEEIRKERSYKAGAEDLRKKYGYKTAK